MNWRSCFGHGFGSAEDVLSERAALVALVAVLANERNCSYLRHVPYLSEMLRGFGLSSCLRTSKTRRAYFREVGEQEGCHRHGIAVCWTTLVSVARVPRY